MSAETKRPIIPQHDDYVCAERSPNTNSECTRASGHWGRHLHARSVTFDSSLSEVVEVWGEDEHAWARNRPVR